jgi:hypothetical protein
MSVAILILTNYYNVSNMQVPDVYAGVGPAVLFLQKQEDGGGGPVG